MNKKTLSLVKRIAKKTNCPLDVTFGTVDNIIKTLAVSYPEIFSNELSKVEKRAVNRYDSRGGVNDEYYTAQFDMIESIMKALNIELDYGVGLYPSFELNINQTQYTEYSPLNAFHRLNNFWNNN